MARGKLNPKLQEAICKNLSLGMTYKASAEAEGIPAQTFWVWMKKGEQANTGRYRIFHDSVRAAVAKSQKVLVGIVLAGAKEKDPKLALELLARRWPEEFGKKDALRLTHEGEVASKVKIEAGSDEEMLERLAVLGKRLTQLEGEDDGEPQG